MDIIVTDIDILHQKSVLTSYQEIESMKLTERLKAANKTAWCQGAGLAAIQIGIPLRFSWCIHAGKEIVLLNSEILQVWGEDVLKEGCLSIPNKWVEIKRAWTIKYVTGGKKRKEHKVSGFIARLIQHEIDHMNGILITDKKIEKE